jgi:hypothetical protein
MMTSEVVLAHWDHIDSMCPSSSESCLLLL